jgi:hypothetical protein
MKLIVTGATGFVGSEVIRQALRNPAVTSVAVIARKAVPVPPNEDASKLKSFVLDDWTSNYPDSLIEHIKGADACIWYIYSCISTSDFCLQFARSLAVTPSQSRSMDFAQVTTICHDYTINGIQNMIKAANKPFRFVYVSGILAERDQSKILPSLGEYRHLRVSSSFYHLFLVLSFD